VDERPETYKLPAWHVGRKIVKTKKKVGKKGYKNIAAGVIDGAKNKWSDKIVG
jgi:hypothetical protein